MILSPIAQEAQHALKLLQGYSFELGQHDAESQIQNWLKLYRASWIRDAVVEALYQGRYKAISVQQILALWQRRGQPVRHFNSEFEQAIGRPVGIHLAAPPLPALSSPHSPGAADLATPTTVEVALTSGHEVATAPSPIYQQGVLYEMHQPIKPFQPELPFYTGRRRQPAPAIKVSLNNP